MKITQWLGFNEESSQYLLRRGELRALVNLQPRRPGMLMSRPGLIKLYGRYDSDPVCGLYRRDTPFGTVGDLLCFQLSLAERELTLAQIAAKEFQEELVWLVRRIQGNQERVIHQIPLSPNGSTNVTNFSVAEDRHGRMFIFFGHGAKPVMYRPSSIANVAVDLGMASPMVAPVVEPTGDGYFLESVDVASGGGSYWAPPTISVSGGSPTREAKVRSIVQGGNLVGVDVLDGGAGYKTAPTLTVSSDKVGSGFRAVGLLEQDPGIQGFVDTTPGVVTGTAPTAVETVGTTNGLDGNQIMYLASPVTASTRTVAQPATSTTSMVLQSIAGIGVGDVVTVYSGTVPPEFTSTSVIRVMSINESTKTVTLSKSWTPALNTSYLVQFRKDTSIGYADAAWDATSRRFTASVPLRTTRGVGTGAEATLTLSPMAYSYGLGAFTQSGYTVPGSASFAYKETGWDNYINDEYWQGTAQDKKDSKENATYAGLQASGESYVFGYTGTVSTKTKSRSTNRRADVYWPDYSAISVWLSEGVSGGSIKEYTRADAKVYEDVTGQPYALVTLRPASKEIASSPSGRKTQKTTRTKYTTVPGFRPPVVRINLRRCPDSWVTTDTVNGNHNLPTSVKEDRTDRQKWWHSSAVTPRPIVDLRGSASRLDAATVEIVDPGAGWERDTTFSLRIHQANAYDQRTDYNTAVREDRIKAGHKPFSETSRFVEFVFKATTPDNLTPAGPPNTLAGSQYIDVVGTGYRSGDTAAVTLLERHIDSPVKSTAVKFDAILIGEGTGTEFTYTGGVQNAGAVLLNLSGSTYGMIAAGHIIECDEPGIVLDYSRALSVSGAAISLDKMRHPQKNAMFFAGTTSSSPERGYINVGATSNVFYEVGRRLRDAGDGKICTIESVYKTGSDTILAVTGQYAAGSRTYHPVFSCSAYTGLSQAQTVSWTAEQIAAGTGEQRVTSVRILSGGRNYLSPPSVLVRGGGNGYGLSVRPNVDGGKITSVEILDPGRAYTAQPELYTSSSSASATPVMRPTMRGVYRCAYRFVDRSETLILDTEITGVRGDSPTVITLASTDGVEPGMILESDRLPLGTRVVSVRGSEVEINQEATGVGLVAAVVVEDPGSGYGASETITCTLAGATGASFTVTKKLNSSGTYSVNDVAVGAAGTAMFSTGRLPVAFSAPAAGGARASGYAYIRAFNPASTYSKVVTVRDMSKPTSYSNFSPIVDVDAGPNASRSHSSEIIWKLPGVTPPTRADRVELWRTSADQSLVFYRTEAYGIPTSDGVQIVGTDTLSDEELFDPDRANYAAMPVVLPNGNVNAYRFGQPRTDMSVCVAFQDRLWFGVSTSGKEANTLFYSEFDEFESCPDVNDLPIQNNQRATDSLTALVPYGSMLLAMQNSHTYSITYNTDPAVDGAIQMLTHRGCLHQRCWDMNNSVFYAADENGIYSMDRSGNIMDISAPFREWFTNELIDFSKREAFFLKVCPKTAVLRFFCCLVSDPQDTPTFALCFDIDRKTWWTEHYPNSMCSAVASRPGVSRINNTIFGADDGNLYEMTGDKDHAHNTLIRCEIRNGGSGYRRSPKITCPNSKGVQLKAVVSEGSLVDVLVYASGWDCTHGVELLFPGSGGVWRAVSGHDGRDIHGEEYAPIPLDIGAPEPGGVQAEVVAHFSQTTKLARDVTVSAGESFVRVNSIVTNPIDTFVPPFIAAEDGLVIAANGGALEGVPLQTELPPVEIGMEAIGDFLPLNCYVSKIIGQDIYLEHPDGTPVVTLGGAARIDGNSDGWAEAGGTQTIVYFRKPYYTHIPFRLATGALQLANEEQINKGGDGLIDRSVSLVYTPTEYDKEVEIVEYYNDSSTPRPNVMRRSRGGPGGFEHRQDSASTVLNLARGASHLGDATGVAKATFASRVYADATGEDQHVQVELYGRPSPANGGTDLVPQRFVMHSMTVQGVVDVE